MPEKYESESMREAKELMQEIPIADSRSDRMGIDGSIVGTYTRDGNMTAQMQNFWDQTAVLGECE